MQVVLGRAALDWRPPGASGDAGAEPRLEEAQMPEQLPTHEVVAFNTATASENRIHDDEVAASLGFGGGLVPGVDVYAYLCRPIVELWGADFCASGSATVRLDRPVHDGETVEIRAELDDGGVVRAEAHTVNGNCASLEASVDLTRPAPPASGPAPLPAERPAASPESLPEGSVLGSYTTRCSTSDLGRYLVDMRDGTSPLVGVGLVHPAWLLRPTNHILSNNVVLGPWMHVGSVIHHHRAVELGEELAVEGSVKRNYEHKGHRFVVLDVVMVDADRSVCCVVEHTAIYEPRQVRETTG
jgi:acyl dehydratase